MEEYIYLIAVGVVTLAVIVVGIILISHSPDSLQVRGNHTTVLPPRGQNHLRRYLMT